MSDSPKPTRPTRPTTQSGGINVGDLTSEQDINVTFDHVASRDQIINSPGTQIINEAPRQMSGKKRLAKRDRQTMIQLVRKFWIEGVLNNSLHSKIIPLDIERNPGAVTRPRPWDVLWQHKGEEAQPLPSGTKLIDLFHQDAGDALLILGEPGSGKTTMLLELARDLLYQTEQDGALRIPVVFNLSSWALKRPPLTEWLAAELNSIYQIPPKVAEAWVKKDEILPLLDGLDEVAQAQRVACIEAINTYRAEHGLTPIVVCSRIADYEAVGTKLTLSDALILRPLTKAQVDEYLAAGGRAFEGIREALVHDELLQEMAQSPLMLGVMALTYRNYIPEKLVTGNLEEHGWKLFATYVDQMIHQHQAKGKATIVNIHQLAYLARQMTQHEQTIFLVERLQPDWATRVNHRRLYRWTVALLMGFVFSFVGLWVGGLVSVLASGNGLIGIVTGGLVGGLIGLGFDHSTIEPVEKLHFQWNNAERNSLLLIVLLILLVPILWPLLGLFAGLSWGLCFAPIGTFIGLLIYAINFDPFDDLAGLLASGLTGTMFGLFVGVLTGILHMIFSFIQNAGQFIKDILGMFFLGLETETPKVIPNDGIRKSNQNALRIGLIISLSAAFVSTVLFILYSLVIYEPLRWSFSTVVYGMGGVLIITMVSGIVGLIYGGGMAVVQHYTLRFWLYYYGYLPFNLVPFLDQAADRLILQKIGGGYRFTHRLLQEYLSRLYAEKFA